jgi:general secretion pathway protein G
MMFRSQSVRRRRGFTLMELLVVLGILAMLMGLVVPSIMKSQGKADVSNTKIQIKGLVGCLKQYKIDMKEYPTTEQGLRALLEKPADLSDEKAEKWDGPYTENDELPKDPWGHDYQYEYPPKKGTGDAPDLWSFGPDGEDGTDDDVVSWSSSSDKEGDSSSSSESSSSSKSSKDSE